MSPATGRALGKTGWLVIALAVVTVSALVPDAVDMRFVLPLLLIVPLQLVAGLGARDPFDDTKAAVSVAARTALRLFAVRTCAGFVLQLVLWLRFLVRSVVHDAAFALARTCALFAVSACAVALGTLTRTSRAFEAPFVVLWFLGPLNHVADFDLFAGLMRALGIAAGACAAVAAVAGATAIRIDAGREIVA